MARYLRWIFSVKGYWPRIIVASLFLQAIAMFLQNILRSFGREQAMEV